MTTRTPAFPPRARRALRTLPAILALAALVGLAPAAGAAGSLSPAAITSLAATGDSITRAYNTGPLPYADYPAGSWATGTGATLQSVADRAAAAVGSAIPRYNDGRSGAKVADLPGQMATVASRDVAAVTVLIGGNDVCTSSLSSMTSVADFRTRFAATLAAISADSTHVLVASVPDVYLLWQLFKGSRTARSVWSTFRICQSLLANPTSTQRADVDRRAAVRQRVVDYNAVLAELCAAAPRCTFDGNAVFDAGFTTADVTTRDYFHPSAAGQRKLAAAAWAAWFPTP